MARSLLNSDLMTRTARLKLKIGTRYFQKLGNGNTIIYRRTGDGFGVWSVKIRTRTNIGSYQYKMRRIGAADDFEENNGDSVLTFNQAQDVARKIIELATRQTSPTKANAHLLTVTDAATRYLDWYKANRKALGSCTANIDAHILPRFGHVRLCDIDSDSIRSWHQELAATAARKRTKRG
ncbi:MAG: hypothetical protein LH481_06075, partial [Burkholderiales bacterium]|nr:hypothetical protein [Burkholderiales bacterium]